MSTKESTTGEEAELDPCSSISPRSLQAAHWSMVSKTYQKSSEALEAFESSIKVLEQGKLLYADSGR